MRIACRFHAYLATISSWRRRRCHHTTLRCPADECRYVYLQSVISYLQSVISGVSAHRGSYGTPGPTHTTDSPLPIDHTTRTGTADTEPADAVTDRTTHCTGSTHNHDSNWVICIDDNGGDIAITGSGNTNRARACSKSGVSEHRESDDGFDGAESEGSSHDQPEFAVHALQAGVRKAVGDGGVDAGLVFADGRAARGQR